MNAVNGDECLLVKTASEISLKTSFVRQFFTKKLVESIKFSLKKNGIPLEKIAKSGGRLYLFCSNPKKAQDVLSRISGIHATALAVHHKPADLKTVEETTLAFAKNFLKKGNKTGMDRKSRIILKDWQEGKIKCP